MEASVGPVTKNRVNSLVAQLFFILKVRFERTLRRGWLVSVSSPLVSVVSTMGGRAAEGPWLSLSNTSSSSANKTTDVETTELRSHTEQFRSTNWSIMDPGADYSPPLPRNGRDTPADALWLESSKTKDLQFTDLKQENRVYKHGANEE